MMLCTTNNAKSGVRGVRNGLPVPHYARHARHARHARLFSHCSSHAFTTGTGGHLDQGQAQQSGIQPHDDDAPASRADADRLRAVSRSSPRHQPSEAMTNTTKTREAHEAYVATPRRGALRTHPLLFLPWSHRACLEVLLP